MVTREGFAGVADSYLLKMSGRIREDILANVSKTERTAFAIENELRHFATEGRQVDNSGWKHDVRLNLPFYKFLIGQNQFDRAPDAQLVGCEFKRKHLQPNAMFR